PGRGTAWPSRGRVSVGASSCRGKSVAEPKTSSGRQEARLRRPSRRRPAAALEGGAQSEHLEDHRGGLRALVAGLPAGALERLVEGVARQESEPDRQVGVQARVEEPARRLG